MFVFSQKSKKIIIFILIQSFQIYVNLDAIVDCY